MKHKVARTELEPNQYSRLAATARKKGLSIKAPREAAARWARAEGPVRRPASDLEDSAGSMSRFADAGKVLDRLLKDRRKSSR